MIALYRIVIELEPGGDIRCGAQYGRLFETLPLEIREGLQAVFTKIDLAIFDAMRDFVDPDDPASQIKAYVNPDNQTNELAQHIRDAGTEVETTRRINDSSKATGH